MTFSLNNNPLLSSLAGPVDKYRDGYKRGYFILNPLQYLLLFFYALGVASFLLYPLHNGEFWWVDDHQIMFFRNLYDSEANNIIQGIWIILQQTEVVQDFCRFRPVYFLFVALKVIFLNTEPGHWFFYNFLIYTTCSICFGLAIARRFPYPFAFLAITALACFKFNNQLWPRLGPAEIEAMLGFSIAGLGLLWHRTDKHRRWTWAFMCIGTAISIGCKENFLLMLCPLCLIFLLDLKDKQCSINHFIWLIPVVLVSVPVIKMITTLDTDVYSQPIGSSRYLLILDFIRSKYIILLTALLTLYFSATFLILKKKSTSWNTFLSTRATKVNITALLAFVILFIIAAGNIVVYSGHINPTTRYAFPYSLMPLFGLFAAIYAASPLLHKVNNVIICRSIIIISILLSAIPFYNELKERRDSIAQHIVKTKNFTLFRKATQKHQNIILFNPFPTVISIFELNKSLDRYSKAGLIPNSYLYPLFPAKATSILEKALTRQLKEKAEANPAPPISRDTYLLARSKGKFMQLEHSKTKRSAENILTIPDVPLNSDGIKTINDSTTIYVPFSFIPEKSLLHIHSGSEVLENSITLSVVYDGKEIETALQFSEKKNIIVLLDRTAFSPSQEVQFFTVAIHLKNEKKNNAPFQLQGLTLE